MTVTAVRRRTVISDPAAVSRAAHALADGAVVAQAFGNFYVITTRADEPTVRGVNLMKGRPPNQVGSITGPPAALPEVWDLDRLPDRLPRAHRPHVAGHVLRPRALRLPRAGCRSTCPLTSPFPTGRSPPRR